MANTSPRGVNLDHPPEDSYSIPHTSSSSRKERKSVYGISCASSSSSEWEASDPDLSRHDILKGPQQKNPPGGTQVTNHGTDLRKYDDDHERPMAWHDVHSKLKQQDDSSLMRAREECNNLTEKQEAPQYVGLNMKKAEEMQRNRYSIPKVSLERRAGTEEVDLEEQIFPGMLNN